MSEKEILQKTAPGAEDAGNEVDNPTKLDFEENGPADSNNAEEPTEESAAAEDLNMDETEEERKQRGCRQIEFYFSDSNLPYDKYMWTLHTANSDHWVPVKTVASFKRMREFQTYGTDWLVQALRVSEELEVDESGANVRRRTEVKEPKGQFERSIYAKGFGKETPGLQQKLEKLFNQYGRVKAVRMRRIEESKEFKGSVFVEFSDMSTVQRFLEADPKPTWEGEELKIMSKDDYCKMKIKEKGLTGQAAQRRREKEGGSGVRKGFNAFIEMKQKAKQKSGKEDKKEPEKQEVFLEFMGKRLKVVDEDGGKIDEAEIPYVKGSSLKIRGLDGTMTFDEVKGPLKERFQTAPFIKFEKDTDPTTALVGFSKALSDEDVAFVKDKIKKVDGRDITWDAAEEAEEKAFLVERAQTAARRVMFAVQRGKGGNRGGNRGGRGGGRGGRGGRGGGGRGRDNDRGKGKGKPESAAAEKGKDTAAATKTNDKDVDEQAGEKRKRAVEPDGGPHAGTRGVGVPPIISSKKSKTEEES